MPTKTRCNSRHWAGSTTDTAPEVKYIRAGKHPATASRLGVAMSDGKIPRIWGHRMGCCIQESKESISSTSGLQWCWWQLVLYNRTVRLYATMRCVEICTVRKYSALRYFQLPPHCTIFLSPSYCITFPDRGHLFSDLNPWLLYVICTLRPTKLRLCHRLTIDVVALLFWWMYLDFKQVVCPLWVLQRILTL